MRHSWTILEKGPRVIVWIDPLLFQLEFNFFSVCEYRSSFARVRYVYISKNFERDCVWKEIGSSI